MIQMPPQIDIRLQGVSHAPEGVQVLAPLDLTLTERRIGVIGRNGSGKSSLSRLIAGLVAPATGTVRINGIDVLNDRRGALGAVGILFQNPDHQIIFPTVAEEISFGLRNMGLPRAEARARVEAILAQMGCADWAARPTGLLSHGQKHLLCLMSVLAMRPALLILDEPMAGLDLVATRVLQRRLNLAEPALLHVSHDLEAFAGYDRMLWIDQGRLRMDGPPDQVIPAYRTEMEAQSADASASL